MAQADGIVSNGSGAAVRADINNQLAAVFTNHSGTTEPATTYAYQFWADTTNNLLKIRNSTNSGWVTLRQLDGEFDTLPVENGTNSAPSIYFRASGTDSGFYSPGTDQVAVSTAGVERVNFNAATEVVFNDTGADVDFRIEGDTEENLFVVDAGTNEVRVKNLNGGPLAGTRNRIINGDMRISQRGTTFATLDPASGTYTLDRWQFAGGSAGRVTIAQSSAVPNNTFSSSLYGDVVTADTSIAASDVVFIQQTIEGFNARDLIGTTFTISFWVYSTKTGVFCVALRNSVADRSYVAEYTVSASNTWEYKTITVSGGLITSGTWDWTNGIGFRLAFALACGTTFQTTSGAWQTGNFIGTSNQVNALDSTANDFYITGVQLEPGSVATPFERRSYGQELALCERYYEKSYNLAAVPGTNVGPNTGEWVSVAVNAADYNDFGRCSFRTRKRASPTMSIWSTDGTANTARQQDASNVSVVVRTTFNETSGSFGCGSATAGYYHRIHFAASAEL
jgi:hypothetical protein